MDYCNYCRRPYTQRRSDQKFCSSKCRNYNKNKRVKEENEVLEPALKILKKNYAVLKKIIRTDSREFYLDELINMEFNPDYFTHFVETEFGLWRCIGDLKFSLHYFRQTNNRILIDWIE